MARYRQSQAEQLHALFIDEALEHNKDPFATNLRLSKDMLETAMALMDSLPPEELIAHQKRYEHVFEVLAALGLVEAILFSPRVRK